MSFILLIAGAVAALVFIVFNFFQVLRKNTQTGFFSTLLAFLTTLLPVTALAVNQPNSASSLTAPSIGLAVVVVIAGAVMLFLELRNPERVLNKSHGILSIGVGVLVMIAIVAVPIITNIQPQMMGVAAASGSEEMPVADVSPVLRVVSEKTGLDSEIIQAQVSDGKTLAQIVEENGANVDEVITEAADAARAQIEQAIEAGEIDQTRANSMLENIETMTAQAFNGELPQRAMTMLLQGVSFGNRPPGIANAPTLPPAAAASPTDTATPTPTRIPLTPTPTITPFLYSSPTPTATPTYFGECEGDVTPESNLNMRKGPGTSYGLVRSIPAASKVTIEAYSADGTWLYVSFEGNQGWVSTEFVTVSGPICEILPTQMP